MPQTCMLQTCMSHTHMSHRRLTVRSIVLLAVGALFPAVALAQHPVHTRPSTGTPQAEPGAPVTGLDAPISVTLDAVPLSHALEAIARQAAIRISLTDGVTRVGKRVTLHVQDMRALDVFRAALADTKVEMTIANDGQVLFAVPRGAVVQASGSVAGKVTDAESKRALASVTVTVEGTKRTTKTNEAGQYVIIGLPVGNYRIAARLLGYTGTSRAITIRANDTLTADFALASVPERLAEVVTTGAGERPKLEVGNSIATINVDSIVQTTPVRNISDLLKGRAPGVEVLSTSGDVGSGSRIRIRGVSSIKADADPIVIVDGLRVDASYSQSQTDPTTAPANNLASGTSAMSRIDDIDMENVESIEVLRGPSAATLYGSDAANGVIVIKTKRGHAGAPRWSAFGEGSTSHMDATFPEDYRSWGTTLLDPSATECTVMDHANGLCTIDSVTHFNPLNHKDTSPFANGSSSSYGVQVSGGASQLQYFLGANMNDDIGMLKLPAADAKNLEAFRDNAPLPEYTIRPNVMNGFHVSSKLTAQPVPTADVALTTNVEREYHRDPGGSFVQYSLQGPGYRDSLTNGWGQLTPSRFFTTLSSDQISRGQGGLNGNWRPWSALSARWVVGADYADRTDESLERKGDEPDDLTGHLTQVSQTTLVRSAEFGVAHDLPLLATMHLRSSVGGQYARTDVNSVTLTASGLADGSDVANSATTRDVSQAGSAKATAGWYVEETAVLNDRFFLTGALRGDAGSGFGTDAKAVYYPKWSLSWLVSQEPFFPQLPGLSNLRLRAAYGHAGVQPPIDARFRSFHATDGFVGSSVPSISVLTIGNPLLLPERSVEMEGGFDLSLWNERLSLEATMYQKITRDALVDRPLPPSLGVTSRQENIGKVDNRGIEFQATVRPIETALLDWNLTVGYSHNQNKLVTLGPATIPSTDFFNGGSTRYVPGYPLNGFWDRKILSYADVNGNGAIDYDEYELSDSAVYMGQPFPKQEVSIFNDVGLWSGLVRVSASLTYTGGLTQRNSSLLDQCYYAGLRTSCQVLWDPTTSLRDQALYYVAVGTNAYRYSAQAYYETISWLRLNELSITFAVPPTLTRRVRAQSASIALMGRNFGLWSKYRGADPEVNTSNVGNNLDDEGGIPQPRTWGFRINLGY